MNVIVYSTKPYDRLYLEAANRADGHRLLFVEAPLSAETAGLSHGHAAVCIFVNDRADRAVLTALREGGTTLIALRCAGFNNAGSIRAMKPGAMLVNTSRGGLIDTAAVIAALKSGRIGALALDVYEEEADLFFEDLSGAVIRDDVFARLTTFPNVLITGHQAYFTHEALTTIAATTLANVTDYERRHTCDHAVHCDRLRHKA